MGHEALIFLALGTALGVYYFVPLPWIALLGALGFLALACLRLHLALIYVVWTAPFYLFPRQFNVADLGLTPFIHRSIPLSFSLVEFTVLACMVAFLVRSFVMRQRSGAWPELLSKLRDWRYSLAPPLLVALAATLSLLAAEQLHTALREYRVVILEPLLFYFLLLSIVDSRQKAHRFVLAFVLLGVAVSLFSIYHYFFIREVESTEGVRRLLAVYHSPNALGLFLGRVAPIAIVFALFDSRRRWLYTAGAAIILITLYFTYSRGAWLGVACALLFVALLQGRRWIISVGAVIIAAVAGLLALIPFGRLISSQTVLQRLYLWGSALDMIRDHPFLGVGLDNFLYQYPRYMNPEAWAEPDLSHPHNILLDFWTRTGILGIISLFALQIAFWKAALALYRTLTGLERVLVLALMASMVDFLAHGLIDNSFFLIDLAFIFWLTYGLIMALRTEPKMENA